MIGTPFARAASSGGMFRRHTRAHDDFVGLEKAFDSVLTRFPRNPECVQFTGRQRAFRNRSQTLISPALEKPRRRHSTSCHTHHNNHLNFNVDRLNNAKINAAIQNRMMTFDSFQPISSK